MKLKHYLFVCLSLLGFASCSEKDDTVAEYANWQAKNEAYFEQAYQEHLAASSSTCFILKSYTKADTLKQEQLAHTDFVLIDVLPSDFIVQGDKTVSPIFTDEVDIHYRGNLLPSLSYPSGYQFDTSINGTFSQDRAEPSTMGVDAVLEGFATALQHMHRGDHWRVTIPYQLGYGTSDYNSIPGYSTLIFDIRLVDFEEGSNG
jgi:FKBP-type peptidyl-prolyl cis-trans isomerase FklB